MPEHVHTLPAGGSHISYCVCLIMKLHCFALHGLLVEAKFPTAHALPSGGSRISYCTRRIRV